MYYVVEFQHFVPLALYAEWIVAKGKVICYQLEFGK